MRRLVALMIITVAVAVVLGGCSGAGAPSSDLRGAGLQSVAKGQLNAVALVSSWVGVLYQQQGGGNATPPIRTEMPDGSLRFTGTNSDGSVYEWFVLHPTDSDSPGHGTITWPDGTSLSQEWEARVWSADHRFATHRLRETYPNGAALSSTTVSTVRGTETLLWTEGTAKTAAGVSMQFNWDRNDSQDALTLALPDGSRLSLTIPLTAVAGAPFWPRFRESTTGKFTGPAGEVLDLTLTGTTADAWDRWELTASDGTTGAFSLAAGLAGTGQLRQAGQLVGALGWDAGALGTLDLLGSGGQEATPSAAARDFQISNWVRNAACLGPMPMY